MKSIILPFNFIKVLTICLGGILLYPTCLPKDKQVLEISIFEPVCRVDTIRHKDKFSTCLIISYLVNGYHSSPEHEIRLDSFVCTIQDSTWNTYDQCLIQFYKKSYYTNNENITRNPRDLDRYSQENDFLYQYRWSNGVFYSKVSMKGKPYYDKIMCHRSSDPLPGRQKR